MISLFLSSQAQAGDITRSHDFIDGEILTAALLDTAFDEVVVQVNDLTGDNFASNIVITTSGTTTLTGALNASGISTFTGTFAANGTTNSIGNGGSDLLTLNLPGGMSSAAMTWTLSGALTISGTIANLGIVTTVDINGGTIDGTIVGGASKAAGTFTTATVDALVGTTNLDIGSFELRAQTLQSDVATGTAPVIVASTTKVTNLNADLLDGVTSAEFRAQVFTSSDTFTAPAGVTKVYLSMAGAGGGGGSGSSAPGGGGGASEVKINVPYTVVAGNNYTVTIGTSAVDSTGGTTSFDGVITAVGGAPGSTGPSGPGGAGGVGSSGNASTITPGTIQGINGGTGGTGQGTSGQGGAGGGNRFAAGGAPSTIGVVGGSGGGGGGSGGAAQAGGSGIVIVMY